MSTPRPTRGILRFVALSLIVCVLIAVAHVISPLIPGPAGEVFRANVHNDVPATALLYTETCNVREYIDAEQGRYRTRR